MPRLSGTAEDTFDFPIPAPLPPAPDRLVAVGRHGPASVDAEDFSRRLGNWGSAARLIGDRWEALAPDLLCRRLPWTLPAGGGRAMRIVAVLALDADPVAGSQLQRAGVSASDLLLVGQLGRGAVLRAADCKVSLDTADPAQTAPARMQATFERIRHDFPEVSQALRRQLDGLAGDAAPATAEALEAALRGDWQRTVAGEGLFVAPESGFNRWFLEQLEERRRTGAPLGRLPISGPRRPSSEVSGPVGPAQLVRLTLPAHLEQVTGATFLGELPGWEEARVVAELDGCALDDLELSLAERCWRVGAGLRGAVLALRRPLFRPGLEDTQPDGRPRDVARMLRQVAERRRPDDSAGLISAVARTIATRRPLWERESALLQAPLSFGAFMTALGAARRETLQARDNGGAEIADREEVGGGTEGAARGGVNRASGRVLYKDLSRRHRQRVLAVAAGLLQVGEEEQVVLEALEERLPEWRSASEADAAQLAREA